MLVERAQVAGAIPAFIFQTRHRLQFAPVPVAAGDAAAAYQNFSIVRQLDFTPRQDLADGAATGMEGMVQADQRSRLCQSISLDHGVSQAMPEFLRFAIQRGAPADHGPELPSEPTTHIPEGPPAPQKVLPFGCGITRGKILAATTRAIKACVEIAFDLLLQRLDHARHGHQHRDPFPADRRHDCGWVECVFKNDRTPQQRWKKNSQELSEDVAQRQQVQEANRMHQPFVLQVFSDFGFDRDEVADHIGVGEQHSLRLGRGAGRENNFERIGRQNLSWTKARSRTFCDCGLEIDWVDHRDTLEFLEDRGPFARTQHQLRAHHRADPARKIRSGGIVDGDSNYPAKRASQERRHPLGTVRTPQQHRIALCDIARFELAGKLTRHSGDARVVPALSPVSPGKHVGAVAAPALEIVQRIQHTCPHTLFSSTIPTTLQAGNVAEHKLYGMTGTPTRNLELDD